LATVAPDDTIATLPVYVPCERPLGLAEIVTAAGRVVLVEEALSHPVPESVVTAVVNGGVPALGVTCTEVVAGVAPPAAAVNDTDVGFNVTVKAAATLSVTGILVAKPVPLCGVSVMVPE
jgi:hypothetical protein